MGGPGSGNRRWPGKKPIVEDALVLAMGELRSLRHRGLSGVITWSTASRAQASVGYSAVWDWPEPRLMLHYRVGGSGDVRLTIRLTAMPVRFGGVRWWFVCPLGTGDGVGTGTDTGLAGTVCCPYGGTIGPFGPIMGAPGGIIGPLGPAIIGPAGGSIGPAR